jgi:hypothetical protein
MERQREAVAGLVMCSGGAEVFMAMMRCGVWLCGVGMCGDRCVVGGCTCGLYGGVGDVGCVV